MDASDIAIATMTLVRSAAEEDLLSRSLEQLAALQIPVAIADTAASATFTAFIARLRGVTVAVPMRQGLVAQVQASISCAAAFGTPFVLYTEPDKISFFARHLAGFIARASDAADVGLVLAGRSEGSFATYPPTQRYVESVVNELCALQTGVRGDFTYGPFVMRRSLVPRVSCADETLGWGWRPFVFLAARRQGFQIHHIVGDYDCPGDQAVEDERERIHRLRQLRDNVAGLVE